MTDETTTQTMSTDTDDDYEGNRMLPSNAIATTALDEPAEYAGGERLYAVLFDADYDAMSLDANGDLALLVDAEQAAALRDQFGEIATELEDGDRDE